MTKKHVFASLIAMILFGVFAVSCQPKSIDDEPEEATISLSETSLLLPNRSATPTQVTVSTNQPKVVVTSTAEWLETSVEGFDISIKAQDNNLGRTRKADVLVFAGAVMDKITVTQSAADFILEVSPAEISIPHIGGKFLIDVNSNAKDLVIEAESEANWIRYRSLANNQMIELDVDKNISSSARTIKLYIKAQDAQKEVKITQESMVSEKYILPFLQKIATKSELIEFERSRGSVLATYSGSLPEHGYQVEKYKFITTSPTFEVIDYERTTDDSKIRLAKVSVNDESIVTSEEFKNLLIEKGFEVTKWDTNNNAYEASSKDQQYSVKISLRKDQKQNVIGAFVEFNYFSVQKKAYPTFDKFPYYNCADIMNKLSFEKVKEWELSQGSTLVKTYNSDIYKGEIRTAMFNKDESKQPVISSVYHFLWEKEIATGFAWEIWYSHNKPELAFWDDSDSLGKWAMTDEFKELLLEKENFELIGETEDGTPAYWNLDKNLICIPKIATYSNLNDKKPVLEIIFQVIDQKSPVTPANIEMARTQALKRASASIKQRAYSK